MSLTVICRLAFCEKCDGIFYESRYTLTLLSIMDFSFKNIRRNPRDNIEPSSHSAQESAWSLLTLEHMIRLQWDNDGSRFRLEFSISSNISLVNMIRAKDANSDLIARFVFELRSGMT